MPRPKHLDELVPRFERRYGSRPELVASAPGRVNLIGEHTDYNDGWVLPVAIPYEVNVAVRARDDDLVRLRAEDLDEEAEFRLGELAEPAEALWLRYPQGVAAKLREAGHALRGVDAAYTGDVPSGSGLSSSAAVEVAWVHALAAASGLALSAPEVALVARRAENEWVGVPSGVMDQFISAAGREGHALLLDCRTLQFELIPINLPGVAVVVMDTGVRRELAGSEYRKRRADCEAAVEALRPVLPGISALRDVSAEQLEEFAGLLSDVQLRRARHVVAENARTLEAAAALRAGDAATMGRLMHASHESLRDLYEVSSPELDAVVEIADAAPGVIGARMTGAGFGGAAVALAEQGAVDALRAALAREYPPRTGHEATVFVCTAAEGAYSVRL